MTVICLAVAPTAGTAAAGAAAGGFIARALSDQTLKSWGAPGEKCDHCVMTV